MTTILDFIFPKHCLGCQRSGSYLCSTCISQILQSELVCPQCERLSVGGLTHPLCHKKYGLDGLWSLAIYQASIKKAIQKLKYRFVRDLATTLVDLVINYWATSSPLFLDQIKKDHGQGWLVMSVPLATTRQNWRGFNQSDLIARSLAKQLGLKYLTNLKRVRATRPQVGLLSSDRKTNLRQAFGVVNTQTLINAKVILIDDVWTTGSTLKECTYILKKAGTKVVWAVTLAR